MGCGECKFFVRRPAHHGACGECRRHAPQVVSETAHVYKSSYTPEKEWRTHTSSRFPVVGTSEWCGEFETKIEEGACKADP